MEPIDRPKLVTVFGGSGFVGRYVVQALARRGYRVRVAVRRPELAGFLQPFGNVGQIAAVQANLRYPASIARAVIGADHVVNCVGILFESGRNSFSAVQELGASAVAEAAAEAGAGLTHVSAIGADPDGAADYARTKGRAERAIAEILPQAVIVRPSIIFGPEDDFFNKLGDMARFSPVLPLIGGGNTRFQPVYVGDVAEVVALSVDGAVSGGPPPYELGGPEILTFRACLEEMLKTINRKRGFVSIPWWLATLMGKAAAAMPLIAPPLTADQVRLLKSDNVVSEAAITAGRTLDGLGLRPSSLDAILPTYLVRFRVAGQFGRNDGRTA